MHKDYWVAIWVYVVAVLLTALPFLGIVTIRLPFDYLTLKFLHVVVVFVTVSILLGQLIAYNVMQHEGITTQAALRYLSRLDHVIPVCLVLIGLLGHAMAADHGPIWEVEWIHESALGLVAYTLGGLVTTLLFRRARMNLDEETQSPVGTYVASLVGVVFLLFMTGVMVYKDTPFRTAHHFTGIAQALSGQQ